MLGSVGQLGLRWELPFGAGAGIPVMNRRAAQFLFEQGCAFVTASPELTGAELRTLMAGIRRSLVPSYGGAADAAPPLPGADPAGPEAGPQRLRNVRRTAPTACGA